MRDYRSVRNWTLALLAIGFCLWGAIKKRDTLVRLLTPPSERTFLVDEPQRTWRVDRVGDKHTFRFAFQNVTDGPAILLGMKAYCGCAHVKDLPRTIPARRSDTVEVVIDSTGHAAGETYEIPVELFVHPSSANVKLVIKVVVSEQSTDTISGVTLARARSHN